MQGILRRLARSPGASVLALGVLFSAATVALFLIDLQTRYSSRIEDAKKDTRSFAEVLARQTALTFEDVGRVLVEAQAIRESSLSGKLDSATSDAALLRLQRSSSVLFGIGWTDASGEMLANSLGGDVPRRNISGMSHFTGQRAAAGDQLFVASPLRSPVGDRWLTRVSRRLNNADGSFAGVVTAAIDQSYFANLYRSIDVGKDGTIFLMHRDGRLLAREPEQKNAIGKSVADGVLFTKYLPAADEGTYEASSVVDGVARVVAYKAVPGLPLVLAVSYARSEVLAPWYQHLRTFGPLVLAIVAVILFGTLLLVRQANALATKSKILARTNDRFDAAINNMAQGLCLFDARKRLVISNQRFQKMYDLPDDLLAPGTPLERILRFFNDRGDISGVDIDHHAELIPTESRQIYEPSDGRKFLIQRKSLPDGGWVATHADVTEQKRSAQLLAEKAAELEAINMRFDAALNNMSQGLCMFDAEQKVVVSNARYGEIYHLGLDQIRPGTTLSQILEYRRQKGTNFTAAPEDLWRNAKTGKDVRTLADGRVIAIARDIMPNGGRLTTHEDITERARSEQRIAFLAQHDLLTGLSNRALFSEKLQDAVKREQRHGTSFSVLMLDLDRFKAVNDTLGHSAGDKLLIEVAQRLKSSIREVDVLARLGGDEFAIIQEHEKSQYEGAIALALRVIELIERPFDIDGHQVGIGTSIGIAFAPEHGSDPETLLRKADLALYAAKSDGRNDFRIFQPALIEAADILKAKEGELRAALSGNEFELHYQPVINVRTRRVSGVEAFVRWHHPSRGLLAPAEFLPLAESTGLMLPLGGWILQQACLDAAAWPPHIKVAVNISVAQFNKGSLFDLIVCALAESGLSPERLELEIADASLREQDHSAHLVTIRQLKNLGVSIVLDNCGAGYSSAAYLTSFPFDKIKIDRAVTEGFPHRRDCAAVVASVLALAHGLDIATAAKGVESVEQLEALQAAGVDFAQGYLFGRPVPHSELDIDADVPPARQVA